MPIDCCDPPNELRSFFNFKFVNDGLRPPVGPVPGFGNLLKAAALPEADDGVGIPGLFIPDSLGLFGLLLGEGSVGGSAVTSAI